MWFIDILLILFSMLSVLIMHEVMHIVGLLLFNIKFEIILKRKFKIPVSFYIYTDFFNDKFIFLCRKKQIKFLIVVIIPYIIIIPFFYFLSLIGIFMITVISWIIIISQIISFPLEFIGVKK